MCLHAHIDCHGILTSVTARHRLRDDCVFVCVCVRNVCLLSKVFVTSAVAPQQQHYGGKHLKGTLFYTSAFYTNPNQL